MLLVSTGTFDSATNRVSHYLAVSTIGQERESCFAVTYVSDLLPPLPKFLGKFSYFVHFILRTNAPLDCYVNLRNCFYFRSVPT